MAIPFVDMNRFFPNELPVPILVERTAPDDEEAKPEEIEKLLKQFEEHGI